MGRVKLIIFDLDGTLINSLEDLTDATNYMLSEMGRKKLSAEGVRKLVGQGARRLVERALPDASLLDIDRALNIFLAYNEGHIVDKTRLYQGVKETLVQLRDQGYRLAVISNKNEALCQKVTQTLGVKTFFEAVIGADSMSSRKPSPEPVLKLLRDFRVAAAETVIVGDSINDVEAGKAAGVVTVGCTYGYGELSELSNSDYCVASFTEILELPIFESRKNRSGD
jgi:phosphoglycolate phosphatase